MIIDDILKNRKCVREYHEDANISRDLIDDLLRRAHKVTPSKNQFMPYKAYVLGPEKKEMKKTIFKNCIAHECRRDDFTVEDKMKYYEEQGMPVYASVMDCSYLIVFTQRWEDQPNPRQKKLAEQGHYYEQTQEKDLRKIVCKCSLEVGMFADALSALCAESGLDTSFCLVFPRKVEEWEGVPFIKHQPLLLMSIGKAKVTRIEQAEKAGWLHLDMRPNYDRIVEFVD